MTYNKPKVFFKHAFLCFLFSTLLSTWAHGQRKLAIKYKQGVDVSAVNLPGQSRMLGKAAGGELLGTKKDHLTRISHDVGLDRIHIITLTPEQDLQQTLQMYLNDDTIQWVESLDSVVKGPSVNDPYFNSQGTFKENLDDLWGHHVVNLKNVWEDYTTGEGVVVADINSGLDITHPDIGNVWVNPGEDPDPNGIDDDGNGFVDDINGYNFVECEEYLRDADGRQLGCVEGKTHDPNGDISDLNGHGTHCTGIMSAQGNNNIGSIGVAHGATYMPVRALNEGNSGGWEYFAEAIMYAVNNDADVINISAEGGFTNLLDDAITYAYRAGVILIAPAGNNFLNLDYQTVMPASLPAVITVSAFDPDFNLSVWSADRASNFGQKIDISAPGSDVLSLISSQTPMADPSMMYETVGGTSFSSPYVAGIAALLKSLDKTLDTEGVRRILRLTATDDTMNPGFDPYFGYGVVNAHKAVQMLLSIESSPSAATGDLETQASSLQESFLNGNPQGCRSESSMSWLVWMILGLCVVLRKATAVTP